MADSGARKPNHNEDATFVTKSDAGPNTRRRNKNKPGQNGPETRKFGESQQSDAIKYSFKPSRETLKMPKTPKMKN
ncbi:hypothetical protein E4U39_001345 [Claviceps sp. Clav50 group G5]|nr:hypothetical protein E4U39_001345 [Claviceps sp. Clav50 group G5]